MLRTYPVWKDDMIGVEILIGLDSLPAMILILPISIDAKVAENWEFHVMDETDEVNYDI